MTTPQPPDYMSPHTRLARSRMRLRQALRHIHAEHAQDEAARATGPAWWAKFRNDPGTRLVFDAATAWWVHQPWHKAAHMLAQSVAQALRPLAQRRPFALVLVAAAVGGMLMFLKPWRWISAPALAAGLVPALLAKAVGILHPESWAEMLSQWLKRHTTDSTSSTAQ